MKDYFTIDEANRLIPTLKEQLSQARRELTHVQERLRSIQNDLLEVELAKREKVIHKDFDRAYQLLEKRWQERARSLQGCKEVFLSCHRRWVGQFERMGIVVRDLAIGLVDFPARWENQDFFLCWRMEEEQVSYWHGLAEGFRGRKPLAELESSDA